MTEIPRCDFFALAPRPQKIIIGILNIPEIYRLSIKSKRWQETVKEMNIKLERLEVELGGDEEDLSNEIYINVDDDDAEILKLWIPTYTDSDSHVKRHDVHVIMEYPKNIYSDTAMTDHLGIVGDRLLNMFEFKKRGLTLSPGPFFCQMIWCPFFRKYQNCSRFLIRTHAIPLPLEQFAYVLRNFSGEEIITGNMERGRELDIEVNFEKITMYATNWLSKNMLKNLNAKRVEINSLKFCGVRTTLAYVCFLIQSWTKGTVPNLEYFKCRLYWGTTDLQLMSNYLSQTAWRKRPPLDEKKPLQIIHADIRSNNGKHAYVLIDSTLIGDGQSFTFHLYAQPPVL